MHKNLKFEIVRGAASILLALAVLAGCGTTAPADSEAPANAPPAAEESFSLPEARPLEPLSAPAVITEAGPQQRTMTCRPP